MISIRNYPNYFSFINDGNISAYTYYCSSESYSDPTYETYRHYETLDPEDGTYTPSPWKGPFTSSSYFSHIPGFALEKEEYKVYYNPIFPKISLTYGDFFENQPLSYLGLTDDDITHYRYIMKFDDDFPMGVFNVTFMGVPPSLCRYWSDSGSELSTSGILFQWLDLNNPELPNSGTFFELRITDGTTVSFSEIYPAVR